MRSSETSEVLDASSAIASKHFQTADCCVLCSRNWDSHVHGRDLILDLEYQNHHVHALHGSIVVSTRSLAAGSAALALVEAEAEVEKKTPPP